MRKFLPPTNGLWYLGEQCGWDQYIDIKTNEMFQINIFELYKYGIFGDEYTYGEFQGLSIKYAKDRRLDLIAMMQERI